MKKLTILLFALLCVSAVLGQQKVAVYVAGGQNTGINKVLGDQLVAAFTKSGKYTAVERTDNFLAELNKEQAYQRSGAVDDKELSRLGAQFGVQLICVAEVSEVFGQKYVSARLIDVESAEVINTANKSSALNSMEDLLNLSESLTKELTGKTAKEQAAENQRRVITSNSCEELQEEKPALRAIGKGTHEREQTAKNIAEMQARAQFARAIASKIETVTIENVSGNSSEYKDFAKSVSEEIIKNTIIIKTCKELSDNKYDIWVCIEYQGDTDKMADEIIGKAKQRIPDVQQVEKIKKRIKSELEK